MKPIRFIAPAALASLLASCAAQKSDNYDTASPYGPADAGMALNEPANPIYDTPAAYEESTGAVSPAYDSPNVASAPSAPSAPSNGAAIIHTVVAGDTLSGISAKYKVPISSIKEANRMTNDIVVLGRKMAIPPQ